ncbi:hypothetical protein PROFUN_01606 [Planoprotostelium fungivorum]|uniref:Uncharacterized protein n=1 Tax=Planoprotostelium fungivorum TaxID=1890364 RepID=A0A2P6NTQ5_9EUKA|nr:hypothetical protein PROFUN_01606 [Planoprotostelium fungivorum]
MPTDKATRPKMPHPAALSTRCGRFLVVVIIYNGISAPAAVLLIYSKGEEDDAVVKISTIFDTRMMAYQTITGGGGRTKKRRTERGSNVLPSVGLMEPFFKRQRVISWEDYLAGSEKPIVVFQQDAAEKQFVYLSNDAAKILLPQLTEGRREESQEDETTRTIWVCAKRALSTGNPSSIHLSPLTLQARFKRRGIDHDLYVIMTLKKKGDLDASVLSSNTIHFFLFEILSNNSNIKVLKINNAARAYLSSIKNDTEEFDEVGLGLHIPKSLVKHYISAYYHMLNSCDRLFNIKTSRDRFLIAMKEILPGIVMYFGVQSEEGSQIADQFVQTFNLTETAVSTSVHTVLHNLRPNVEVLMEAMNRMSSRTRDVVDMEIMERGKKAANDVIARINVDQNIMMNEIEDQSYYQPSGEPKRMIAQPEAPLMEPDDVLPASWDSNQWKRVVIRCLEYLSSTSAVPNGLFFTERCRIPEYFGEDPEWTFGYPFRGTFLPSNNEDGFFWRPSQGTKSLTGNLQKRYFYTTTPSGVKLKRHVWWLKGKEEWQIVDYRHSQTGLVRVSRLIGPAGMNWSLLIKNSLRVGQTPTNNDIENFVNSIDSIYASRNTQTETRRDTNINNDTKDHARARGTAVVLKQKQILLFSPIKPNHQVFDVLDSLGEVKYLVCPNIVHHLSVQDYLKRYPKASVFGVPGLEKKRSDLNFTGILDNKGSTQYGFEDEIDYRLFSATRNLDVMLYHRETGNLLEADLIFNLPGTEQYPKEEVDKWTIQRPLLDRLNPSSPTHKFALQKMMVTDAEKMKEDSQYVQKNWKINKIIPCHGNIIDNGQQVFQELFAPYLAPHG